VKLKQLRDKRSDKRKKLVKLVLNTCETCVKKIFGSHLNFNEVKKRLVKLKKEEQKKK